MTTQSQIDRTFTVVGAYTLTLMGAYTRGATTRGAAMRLGRKRTRGATMQLGRKRKVVVPPIRFDVPDKPELKLWKVVPPITWSMSLTSRN